MDQGLKSLEPHQRSRVMDLVEQAGVDVSPWAYKQGGAPVTNPSANPAFCYEWAFGDGDNEPVVLCVWHESLKLEDGRIIYRDNLRQLALRLDDRATSRRELPKDRSRAKSQARRARLFDHRCQQATNKSLPIRVVLLKGERADRDTIGRDASSVEYRLLDSEIWGFESYDMMSGDFVLVRGLDPRKVPTQQNITNQRLEQCQEQGQEQERSPKKYIDQFDALDVPETREVSGRQFVRSRLIRQEVLARASGVCEACGQVGFKTAAGQIYLETHHVVPLSESGPDVVWNIVAICPNDHRIAHYGADRDQWQARMISYLADSYPELDVHQHLAMSDEVEAES